MAGTDRSAGSASASRSRRPPRFAVVVAVLLGALVLAPARMDARIVALGRAVALLVTFLVSFHAVGARRSSIRMGALVWLVFAGPIIADSWAGKRALGAAGEISSQVAGVSMLVVCAFGCLRYVLGSARVTADRIFAAFTAYLLGGLACGLVYEEIWRLDPTAFAFPAGTATGDPGAMRSLFAYYSFVTLTTVGYGDVLPVHDLARFLATVEAMVGQFYLAVVIAWLVSRYAAAEAG